MKGKLICYEIQVLLFRFRTCSQKLICLMMHTNLRPMGSLLLSFCLRYVGYSLYRKEHVRISFLSTYFLLTSYQTVYRHNFTQTKSLPGANINIHITFIHLHPFTPRIIS